MGCVGKVEARKPRSLFFNGLGCPNVQAEPSSSMSLSTIVFELGNQSPKLTLKRIEIL